MGKEAFDRKIEEIRALRSGLAESAEPPLRRALKDRSNYVVAKAAEVAGELQLRSLVADLAAAFERFFRNAGKSDPQCWAKNAVAQALKNLGHSDPAPFLRGISHVQMEPVWGGREDTAITLRGICAHALIACELSGFEVLVHLADLLADPAGPVRLDAARAIAQLSIREGVLLLRLKALSGDREPEVIGQCLASLLSLGPRDQLPFVERFLESDAPEIRAEAAGALAELHDAAAVEILKRFWQGEKDAAVRSAVLRLLGASPVPAAAEFLVSIVEEASGRTAAQALSALSGSRHRAQFRDRVAAVVAEKGDPELARIMDNAWIQDG